MLVYLLRNKVNGKVYVGKTVMSNLNSYLSVKRWAAKNNNPSCMPIVNAIRKYGFENFDVEILVRTDSHELLCDLEKQWIADLHSTNPEKGYNICAGGVGTLGHVCSEEAKRKIGAANRGRKPKGYARTEEHRRQLQERMKGNKHGKGRGVGHFVSEGEREKHLQNALAQWRARKEAVAIF